MIKTIVVLEDATPYVLSILADEDLACSVNKMEETPVLAGEPALFVINCVCMSPFKWRRIKKSLVEDERVFCWTK